jgi:hypothetical protein
MLCFLVDDFEDRQGHEAHRRKSGRYNQNYAENGSLPRHDTMSVRLDLQSHSSAELGEQLLPSERFLVGHRVSALQRTSMSEF